VADLKADLHVHSTASDGCLAPESLVGLAGSVGLTHLAIADHDSVEGIERAMSAARGGSVTVIPAVELSAVSSDGEDVHILGYGIDYCCPRLLDVLDSLREARIRRATRMIDSLAAVGLPISLEDVLLISSGGSVGRSHVARALVSAGHSASIASAFDRLIGHGKPHYFGKDSLSPRSVIETISDAGGIAVIAHPGVNSLMPLTRSLIADGLMGVEAYHADHTEAQRSEYSALAQEHGLLTTGGSDFHSPDGPNPALGSVHYPEAALKEFLTALARG
jgi:hypothetical protein